MCGRAVLPMTTTNEWQQNKGDRKKETKKKNESNLNREQCWSGISGGQLLNLRLTNAAGVFVSSFIRKKGNMDRIVCLLGRQSHPFIVCASTALYCYAFIRTEFITSSHSPRPLPPSLCPPVSCFIRSLRSFPCQPWYLWLLYVLENTFTMTTFILHCAYTK